MARRTPAFTVFRDEPESAPSARAPITARRLTRSLSESALPLANSAPVSALALLGTADEDDHKENVHPHTGEHALSVAALFKSLKTKKENAGARENLKRKTGVLEAKIVVVPAAKKPKQSTSASENRTTTTNAPPPRAASVPPPSRAARAQARPRAPARRTTTAASAYLLPDISEHDEESAVALLLSPPRPRPPPAPATPTSTRTQRAIDARCHDLTVSPLADVSRAYGSPAKPRRTPSPPTRARSKPASGALDLRDPFSSPSVSSYSTRSRSRAPSPSSPAFAHTAAYYLPTPKPAHVFSGAEPASDPVSEEDCGGGPRYPSAFELYSSPADAKGKEKEREVQFSTPERARMYRAFTFESPSPAGARMDRERRGRSTSVDRWGDIPFGV